MRHIVDAIAAQGRNGDDELLHISKGELRDLKTLGNALGIKTTINPKTGIHEAFNWIKPLATIAGGTVGFVASGFNPLGAAAGASLAAGATTAAQGGSTNDVLMNAAISGATAYAGAGIASGLGEAGAATAEVGTEGVTQGVTQGVTEAGTQGITQGATQTMATPATEAGIQGLAVNPNLVAEAAPQAAASTVAPTTESGIQGLRLAPELASTTTPPPVPQSFTDKMIAGFQKTPGMELVDKYGTKAVGAGLGLGTLGAMPNSYGDTTEVDESGQPKYKGETYYDKYGYMRARAVPLAAGGNVYVGYNDEKAAAQGGPISSFDNNYAAGGGISDLGGYSDGGQMLRGPGDGVSDSIPAVIDGKKPARLATGEFVVPARAVSELGNGSSEAGAKQLYGMLDRIQNARKGTTKNIAKRTNPKKLLPA